MDLKHLAAAYVRGSGVPLPENQHNQPLSQLTETELEELICLGEQNGLKMYRFKEKADLPRVRMALGFLKAIYPANLLDVGSGRGVFLFPFMRDFPDTPVTSLDILPHRVEMLNRIHQGGAERLNALRGNICTWNAPDSSYDVVTLLEVLEHICEYEQAIRNAVRIAGRYVVVSVPSKPDNNPEHIHLLTKDKLTAAFTAAGARKLQFDGVNGHLFMTAAKG